MPTFAAILDKLVDVRAPDVCRHATRSSPHAFDLHFIAAPDKIVAVCSALKGPRLSVAFASNIVFCLLLGGPYLSRID